MTGGPDDLAGELDAIVALEGESDQRVRTLLWLARAFYGQDDLDSYAGVFTDPQPLDSGGGLRIDGLVNHVVGDELHHVVFVWIGDRKRADTLDHAIQLSDTLRTSSAEVERELARSPVAGPLLTEMRPLRRTAESVEWRVAVVSAKAWSTSDRRRLAAAGERLDRWDLPQLSDLASARLDPTWLEETTEVVVSESETLLTHAGDRRVFVAPVKGIVIANWPGIESRRLFDLNVRFGLGTRNRVRQSLDIALATQKQEEFIASHNGLTVVCEQVTPSKRGLTIRNFSVVNGAQSVIALHENLTNLKPDLRLLVKFVEVGPDDQLASEIAVRSNTQNPVTGRNLRALDESQIRLRRELADRRYVFDTRPDVRRRQVDREIRNDDAAQWICTVYLERPWLAVKRTSLFVAETFQEIFSPAVSAEHVILLYSMRRAVDAAKPAFPADLRRAWLLTALTAMYLVGQLMRFNDEDRALLLTPGTREGDSASTIERLEFLVGQVVDYMTTRHEKVVADEGYDNFRVEFKRQRTLLEMASEVVRQERTRARGVVE